VCVCGYVKLKAIDIDPMVVAEFLDSHTPIPTHPQTRGCQTTHGF
jgi:hypothetical protein